VDGYVVARLTQRMLKGGDENTAGPGDFSKRRVKGGDFQGQAGNHGERRINKRMGTLIVNKGRLRSPWESRILGSGLVFHRGGEHKTEARKNQTNRRRAGSKIVAIRGERYRK